jgi:hypothetical protein
VTNVVNTMSQTWAKQRKGAIDSELLLMSQIIERGQLIAAS